MQSNAEAEQGLARIFLECLCEGRRGNGVLLLDLEIFGRVREPPSQIGADDPDANAEQKGQPPPPGEARGLREDGIEQRRCQRAEQEPAPTPTSC